MVQRSHISLYVCRYFYSTQMAKRVPPLRVIWHPLVCLLQGLGMEGVIKEGGRDRFSTCPYPLDPFLATLMVIPTLCEIYILYHGADSPYVLL